MLAIILKIVLCSSIFIAVYYLFLEKEKMYRFNRFYLLSSVVLCYIIPFITITVTAPEADESPQLAIKEAAQQITFVQPTLQESFNWMNIIGGIYAFIAFFLLIKSILAVLSIKRIQGKKRIYQDCNVIITEENHSPFSFWNTIYMGKNYLKDDLIDPRIFLHEKSHLDQKHSVDLLLIDLLKIFTWFNPALFLYRKAMVTNHEFLADESVLKSQFNIKEYQNLILEEILSHQHPSLTHSFNFNNTKKRFIMMKAKKSKFSSLKKATGITVLVAASVLFSERTYAENLTKTDISGTFTKSFTATTNQDSYKEFKDILAKYSSLLDHGKYAEFSKKVTESDKKRLEELYSQLTETQRNEQKIIFFASPEFKRRTPTESELQSFLNKKDYAVWIDSEKIENSALKNYKSSDFSKLNISKVAQNARTSQNPQPYQVTLMTHSYFEKTKKERSANLMGFKRDDIKTVQDTLSPKGNKEGKNTNIQEDKSLISAEYPDGMADLRKKIGRNMDVTALDPTKGEIKATAYVHIDETGKTTNITTSGDNDLFNKEFLKTITAISNETTWKPATKDGKPIASVLKIPASMTFTRP